MAVNETTGIDPEVDRFAIYRVSTQQYTNLNAVWPRVDGGPLVGANPDYKYYKRTTTERPDVDHRFTVATAWDKVDADPAAPEGHPAGIYTQTHEPTKLPVADLLKQIETEFQRQLLIQFPATADPAVLIMAADALARKQNGAVLTDEQQGALDSITSTGDYVAQLLAIKAEKDAAAEADEDYDITDWPVVVTPTA